MSKNIFTFSATLELEDGREIDVEARYRYYPARGASLEQPAEDEHVELLDLTSDQLTTGELADDLDDLKELFNKQVDSGELIQHARDIINDHWEAFERDKPDDTPCLTPFHLYER